MTSHSLDTLKYIYMYMSTPQTIGRVGFIFGFVNAVTKKELVKSPLTSIVNGTVHGFLYGACTLMVKKIVPLQFQGIIPILLFCALIYQKCQKESDEKPKFRFPMFRLKIKDVIEINWE